MTPQASTKTKRQPVTQGSGNVFEDLGFSKSESAELGVRAELTRQIHNRIEALALTQARAAKRLGVSQPDVSKLMNGRYTGYSVARLIGFLNALDIDVDILVRRKGRQQTRRAGIVRVLEAV